MIQTEVHAPSMERTTTPPLLIADAHTLLCEAIATAARNAGYTDVRTAGSVSEMYKMINSGWKPGIVLVDLNFASPDDFALIDQLQTLVPNTPLAIMLSDEQIEQNDEVVRAFVKGVMGIVSKDRGVSSLLRVIEVVADGEAAIPRSLARSVVHALRYGPALTENRVGLSDRQREVLALIAQGLTDREISQRLRITLPTVRSHVEAIFEKTGTTNRTAAARWASTYLYNSLSPERTSS